MNRPILLAILVLPLLLLGCSSAQRQYERGMELEGRGDFAAAARYYAEAIRKDRDLNRMLPGRLRESGRQAIEIFVADARLLGERGHHSDAAERFRDADAIFDLGRSVAVDIPLPNDYGPQRRNAFDAAIAALLDEGHIAHDRADFERAVRSYQRADRYEPNREQADDLRESVAAARLSWATWLLDSGRYRQAYDVAEMGLSVRSGYEQAFHRVQQEALDAGTVRLAALPVQGGGSRLGTIPSYFPQHVSQLLDDEYWLHPPLFVATADPRDVRNVVRRRVGRDPLLGNPRLTATVGRDLHADFVLVPAIERFSEAQGDVRRTERSVRYRRGRAATTFTEIRTHATFRGALRYELVDVASRRVLCSDRVERSASGHVLTGEFDGDWRELSLTRDQQALFTAAGREEQERRIQERLADELAEALARRVYSCVGARVP